MHKANRRENRDLTTTFIAAFKRFSFYECELQCSHCTMHRINRVKFDKLYRNFDGSSKASLSLYLCLFLPLRQSLVHICNEFIMHLYLFSRFATPIGRNIFICIERTCSFAFLPLFIWTLLISLHSWRFFLLIFLKLMLRNTQVYKWIVTERNENDIYKSGTKPTLKPCNACKI